MIRIYEDTKIYIVTPAGAVTGGPEALHQLEDKMLSLGLNAYIVYVDVKCITDMEWTNYIKLADTPNQYKMYNVKQSSIIDDNSHNVIIVPEIFAYFPVSFENMQKAIWWLAIPEYTVNIPYDINEVCHLYQSEYAKEELLKNNVSELYPLSDYISKTYMVKRARKKENIVLYNPKNGLELTKEIMNISPDIKFVPLINMSPVQIKEVMNIAKVYIDFGSHPGKDRIPREAAISGCCVLVVKKGSAKYFHDVPISDEYKFDLDNFKPAVVKGKIIDCFDNYENNIMDFEIYRKAIIMEESIFTNEIKSIFIMEDNMFI